MVSRILIFLTFLVISSAVGQNSPVPSVLGKGKHHTSLQLLGSVTSIRPGGTFTVGILMRMDPGWHTYWKSSGEAGLPTVVKWRLPEGLTAGEIHWPLPHKYNETGEVLTYGYADENMLLVDIAASSDIPAGSSITLHADVEWLECENICVPGSASVELVLPVSAAAPVPANESFFRKYRRSVPGPLSEKTGFKVTSTTVNAGLRIHLKANDGHSFERVEGELPDFYPESIEQLAMGRTKVEAHATEATLLIPLSVYEKVSQAFTVRGVVVYQMQGGERSAVVVEANLSKEFCSTLPLSGESSPTSVLDQPFSTVTSSEDDRPLFLFLLFAFIGGVLLNVMPCVLPVIALKIFGLVRMAGDHPREVRRLGWFFSLGILATFLSLALLVIVLQAAGQQVGWGFQFQEPMFVIAMSVIVFAFGLSLFGVYEIGVPFISGIAGSGRESEGKQERKGYASSFTEGVFATILATPCTAPFLGAALGFAFSQRAPFILLIFSVVAFGMALPYLILTTRPAWMKFLPKPGEWMVTVKQFMGFLMMATLIWLLYVLGKQLGMEGVIWTSAFLLCVGVSCWMVGKFATLTVSRGKYIRTWIFAMVVAVAGYWVFLESILDVRNVIAGFGSVSTAAVTSDERGVQWQPFSLAALDSHIKDNKTVFIDFTADWCLTCKVNEKVVLTDQGIVDRLKSPDIVSMKADWTNRNPEITKLLAKFGRSGVPLYVVFPSGRPDAPIVLPEVITTEIVIDALRKASSAVPVG